MKQPGAQRLDIPAVSIHLEATITSGWYQRAVSNRAVGEFAPRPTWVSEGRKETHLRKMSKKVPKRAPSPNKREPLHEN